MGQNDDNDVDDQTGDINGNDDNEDEGNDISTFLHLLIVQLQSSQVLPCLRELSLLHAFSNKPKMTTNSSMPSIRNLNLSVACPSCLLQQTVVYLFHDKKKSVVIQYKSKNLDFDSFVYLLFLEKKVEN